MPPRCVAGARNRVDGHTKGLKELPDGLSEPLFDDRVEWQKFQNLSRGLQVSPCVPTRRLVVSLRVIVVVLRVTEFRDGFFDVG